MHAQIALQQQMFAAARAASMTSADSAAAMAAAYKAQLAAAGQAGQVGGAVPLSAAPSCNMDAAQATAPEPAAQD